MKARASTKSKSTKKPAAKAKKPAAKTKSTTKPAAKAKKPAAKAKKPAAKTKVAAKAPKAAAKAPMKHGPRADFGKPVAGFFAKQPPALRPITEALRDLVEEAAPDATASIKWGMPFYSIGDGMMCAIGAHKAHVNLILSGPPGTFDDPDGRLTGDGKTGRHLKVTSVDDLPRDAVRGWLATAAERARAGA